jgi:hypothetical protein
MLHNMNLCQRVVRSCIACLIQQGMRWCSLHCCFAQGILAQLCLCSVMFGVTHYIHLLQNTSSTGLGAFALACCTCCWCCRLIPGTTCCCLCVALVRQYAVVCTWLVWQVEQLHCAKNCSQLTCSGCRLHAVQIALEAALLLQAISRVALCVFLSAVTGLL